MSDSTFQHPDTPPPDQTLGDSPDSDRQHLEELIVQWVVQREEGHDPPIAELCRDRPHLAAALAGEIALLERFEPPRPVEVQPEPPVREFAGLRYQPLRYHARGGLGVVFVANDTEVSRKVALKRIQERRRHLPQDRERFQREARITGRLEHPGVVPVYSMGQDTSGNPYYTMRFVEGSTLAEAIETIHQQDGKPRLLVEREHGLRALLTRFVAVCQTVAYAHSRGVIHRDLKPSNILVGDFGETLVIDWGLARNLNDHPEEGSNSTQIGKALGTWGFISPEQARGDWTRVGPPSDIFGLGATLYAILTGQAPYGGNNAVVDAQAGKFIRPRQLAREVPGDLEAVCLKAMAAVPEDRYSSALELAADVQRWLDDEPVRARPEPLSQKLRRWARRHRTLVAAGLVLLVAGVVGLSLGLWAVGREQARTVEALEAEKASLERALTAEKDARHNLERAEANLKMARRAIDECFNIATEHPLFKRQGMEKARKLLLEKSLPFYRNFRTQRPNDPVLQFEEAVHWLRVGSIEQVLYRLTQARQSYERARELLDQLVKTQPDVPEHQSRLADTHHNLGLLLLTLSQGDDARREFHQARDLQVKLVKAHPKEPRYQNALAGTYSDLGLLLTTLGEREQALAEYQQALELQGQLVKEHNKVPEYLHTQAITHMSRGWLLHTLWRREEALAAYQQARDLLLELIKTQPDMTEYQSTLAGTSHNLGNLLAGWGKRTEALAEYRRALDLQRRLVLIHPDIPECRNNLALTHTALGSSLRDLGKHQEALEEFQQACDLQSKLVESHSDQPWFQDPQANTRLNLGSLLHILGRRQEALVEYRRGRELLLKLVKTSPRAPGHQNLLAHAHHSLGQLLMEMGEPLAALLEYQRARDLRGKLVKSYPRAPEYSSALARMHNDIARMLDGLGQQQMALQEYREGLTLQVEVVKAHSDVAEYIECLARIRLDSAELLFRVGRTEPSLTGLNQGIFLVEVLQRLDPRHPQVPPLLYTALRTRATVLSSLNRHKDADADWNRALALATPVGQAELLLRRTICRGVALLKAHATPRTKPTTPAH
jgi:serine/threonine-protein kinase